jgi:hypothetical protein
MRYIPVAIVLMLLCGFTGNDCSCFSAEAVSRFDTTVAGNVVNGKIPFRNNGTEPMIIAMVKTSTGAMVAWTTREPIPPGKSDTIHYKFDTRGKRGPQDKTISVEYNGDCYQVIRVTGFVKAPFPGQ